MADLNLQSFHLTSKHGALHTTALGYEFQNQGDFIALPSQWGGTTWKDLTVEAWIKPNADTGDFQAILSPKDTTFIHFQLHREGVGNISIYTDQGAVVLPIIPVTPLNTWRHVAVIAKSGASKVLVDGEQVGDINTKTFNYIIPTEELYIGQGYNQGRPFKGTIADVKIWHDAREHEDIHSDLYQYLADKPVMSAPVVATVFGFKSAHGKYMSAQADGTIDCNQASLLDSEKFTIEDAGNGKYGLKSIHGKYLSAQPDGTLQANRGWLRGWEQFTMEEQAGKVGFKGYHGKYISAQPDGRITCDRTWLRGWELFTKEGA